MNRQRLLPLALLLLGCTAPPPSQADTHAIVNGEPAPDDNAVGELGIWYDAGFRLSTCTATLIAPRFALTAAHCVIGHVVNVRYLTLSTLPDPDVDRSAIKYASSWTTHPQFHATTENFDFDITLVRFPTDIATTTAHLPTRALEPRDVGGAVRFVGYGVVGGDAKAHGQRQQTTSAISAINATNFENRPPNTVCYGDSGGPAFVDLDGAGESIAGIISRGVASDASDGCLTTSFHVRVDQHLEWIAAEMARDVDAPQDEGCAVGGRDPGGALWLLALLAIRLAQPAP